MHSRRSVLYRLLFGACLCNPCWAAQDCEDLTGRPVTFNLRWAEVWQALNDGASCTQNCHNGINPAAELDLSSPGFSIFFLVNQPSSGNPALLRVLPGQPRSSLLLQKVNCGRPDVGGQMPPGGHLPTALQELIYDWIEQGALGENPEDRIAREFIFRDSMESLRR